MSTDKPQSLKSIAHAARLALSGPTSEKPPEEPPRHSFGHLTVPPGQPVPTPFAPHREQPLRLDSDGNVTRPPLSAAHHAAALDIYRQTGGQDTAPPVIDVDATEIDNAPAPVVPKQGAALKR